MILFDSDVLAIYHFFTHDSRYLITRECLDDLKGEPVATTIYNLFELAGILSSGGKSDLGEKIVSNYLNAADMEVLFPKTGYISGDIFWEDYSRGVMDVIKRGVRYGDAKIIWLAELHEVSVIVTWNTRNFIGKTSLPVMTPEEWKRGTN
jgi:predicted nucleic acid-binding protein